MSLPQSACSVVAVIVRASRQSLIAALHASVTVDGVWPAHADSIVAHAAGGIAFSDSSD